MDSEIKKALEILRKGGIVIFPTDTAYGVGCRIDDEKAIAKLFKIRNRPETQAVPVLVDSLSMVEKYSRHVTGEMKQLMQKYWPGALTVVLSCKSELVPKLVRGGRNSIGFRMPNHQTPLRLINELGIPILGPSANFHGKMTPYSFSDLDPEFIKLVDYVMKGKCKLKQVSTVIDVSEKPWKILRQGAVKLIIKDPPSSRLSRDYGEASKKVTLIIDTSNSQESEVGIEINGVNYFLKGTSKVLKAQNTLLLIDKILKAQKLKLKDLTEIRVNRGPGSFTGLRVGISIANILSYILGIPINSKKKGEIETPKY